MTTEKIGWGSVAADKFVLAGTALGLGLLAALAWGLFGRNEEPTVGKKPAQNFTHLHCPACEAELPYSAEIDGQPCQTCEAGKLLVPTVGSFRESEGDGSGGRILTFAVVGGILLQGVAYLILVRAEALRRASETEANRRLIAACPYCSRHVSFPVAKTGTGILCSRCKTAFVLAESSEVV